MLFDVILGDVEVGSGIFSSISSFLTSVKYMLNRVKIWYIWITILFILQNAEDKDPGGSTGGGGGGGGELSMGPGAGGENGEIGSDPTQGLRMPATSNSLQIGDIDTATEATEGDVFCLVV